jgi:hypothetical protein
MGSGGTGVGGPGVGPGAGGQEGLNLYAGPGRSLGENSGTYGNNYGTGTVRPPVTSGTAGAAARQTAIRMGPSALTSSNPSVRYAALHLQQEAAERAAGMPGGAPQAGQPGYTTARR